jgi:pimeloyl-ACP methyl ester carboxylesterase
LDDQTVNNFWGRFDKPVLVLHSEKDEFVPPKLDQAALNRKFQAASPFVSSLSGLIPGTGHTVLQEEAREWLAGRVVEFLRTIT